MWRLREREGRKKKRGGRGTISHRARIYGIEKEGAGRRRRRRPFPIFSPSSHLVRAKKPLMRTRINSPLGEASSEEKWWWVGRRRAEMGERGEAELMRRKEKENGGGGKKWKE